MPWKFQPEQRSVVVKPGEETLIFYQASNPTDKAITGQAAYHVTPDTAGQSSPTLPCLCLTDPRHTRRASCRPPASQSVQLPVRALSLHHTRTHPPTPPPHPPTPPPHHPPP